MKIGYLLKKPYWERIVTEDSDTPIMPQMNTYYFMPNAIQNGLRKQYLTQEDFDKERVPSAHDINSKYQSTRAIQELHDVIGADGKPELNPDGSIKKEWVTVDYDELETVRFGLQERAARTKAAYFAGNGFWVASEEKNNEYYQNLCSYMDSCGMRDGWMENVLSLFFTADSAFYLYEENGELQYHIFSHLKGDTLFFNYDENRNPVTIRLYTLRGMQAVDIYRCGSIETWINGGKDETSLQEWWNTYSGWFSKDVDFKSKKRSEDGWVCIMEKESQISNNLNQCVYFRRADGPVWSPVIKEIQGLEKTASFVAEGVKRGTFSKLFLKAMDIVSLPDDADSGGVIGVKGSSDDLKASDAKFLARPDISNIAEVDFKQKKESIRLGLMDVDITPDILRAGADSSTSIKLLMTPMIQWCMTEWVQYAPQLRYLMNVFKALVAKIEGDGEYTKMRLSIGFEPFLPQNDKERADIENSLVYSGTKSTRAAAADIGNQWKDDIETVRQERNQKTYDDTYYKLKAEADARKDFGMEATASETIVSETETESNPDLPRIDNRASRKGLADERFG